MRLQKPIQGLIIGALAFALAAAFVIGPHAVRADTDQQTITNIIQNNYPGGTTVVYVVVAQNYALALAALPDGQTARQILFVNNGSWTPLRGAGGAFDADDLQSFGVPADVAQTLIDAGETASQ
jgi:hypothetical protein